MKEVKRNSGASLVLDCVVKVFPNASLQAGKMRAYPDVFCPVAKIPADGFYCMPVMKSSDGMSTEQARDAMDRLVMLWESRAPRRIVPDIDEGRDTARYAYANYVVGKCGVQWLRKEIQRAWEIAEKFPGTPANMVHGDATLENIVYDQHRSYWIDPDHKTTLPYERELDVAKIKISLAGYGGGSDRLKRVARDYVAEWEKSMSREVLRFHQLCHIARMLPYQKEHEMWLLSQADIV